MFRPGASGTIAVQAVAADAVPAVFPAVHATRTCPVPPDTVPENVKLSDATGVSGTETDSDRGAGVGTGSECGGFTGALAF